MSQLGHELGYAHTEQQQNTFQSDEKTKLDLPFDLDKLCNFSHSFDQLKIAIEYLARQLGDQQMLINDLMTREPTHTIIEKQNTIVKEVPGFDDRP